VSHYGAFIEGAGPHGGVRCDAVGCHNFERRHGTPSETIRLSLTNRKTLPWMTVTLAGDEWDFCHLHAPSVERFRQVFPFAISQDADT
jgi:hypothetical protein